MSSSGFSSDMTHSGATHRKSGGGVELRSENTSRAGRRDVVFRLLQLLLGLFGWGLAIALFIRSELGLGPWDAFHYGLHVQTGITVGVASILAGLLIVLVNLVLGVRPGVATVLNMVLIGVFTDLLLPVLPTAPGVAAAAAYFTGAIVLTGLASGAYIGAGFGHGPRDGLMMALTLRTGWTVRRIRTMIELAVLCFGWLMGGMVGIGTVLVTLTVGHSVQWGLRLFGAIPADAARVAAAARGAPQAGKPRGRRSRQERARVRARARARAARRRRLRRAA